MSNKKQTTMKYAHACRDAKRRGEPKPDYEAFCKAHNTEMEDSEMYEVNDGYTHNNGLKKQRDNVIKAQVTIQCLFPQINLVREYLEEISNRSPHASVYAKTLANVYELLGDVDEALISMK